MAITALTSAPGELTWLSGVRESVQPLTAQSPIWVRQGSVQRGPAIPHPERHPYCEFGINLTGEGYQFVGGQKALRRPGDIFLAGPGLPHWYQIERHPMSFVTIYFLPTVLIEIGGTEGLALLRRCTAGSTLADHLVRPPPRQLAGVVRRMKEVAREFDARHFGRMLRLRMMLAGLLLDLIRWEQGEEPEPRPVSSVNWAELDKALQYLHQNFSRAIYASELAEAVCTSETRLKTIFRDGIGIPWGKYLRAYRVQQAAALLATTRMGVIELAAATGFESVSHFEASFREFMGTSPRRHAAQSEK